MFTIGTAIGIFFFILMLLHRPKPGSREAKLMNTAETEVHSLEDVSGMSRLPEVGQYVVKTFRQSGNEHQVDRFFGSGTAAVKAAVSTFRRGKIDLVVVMDCTTTQLSFRRPWHDHRGRSEGKKLGWIEIHLLPADGTTPVP